MARKRPTKAGAMSFRGAPPQPAARERQSGFSLYELLFVVVIISLLATVMMPTDNPGNIAKLDLAASEVADAVRFARSESLRLGEPHGIEFDDQKNELRVFSMDTNTSPPTPVFDVYHPVDRKPYRRTLGERPFEFQGRMHILAQFRNACDKREGVYFDANGTPWCPDPDTILLGKMTVTLYLDNASRSVLVQGINGRVVIE
jgi:prepilin-type N-terminal cleavage/methylation domain-containing protein